MAWYRTVRPSHAFRQARRITRVGWLCWRENLNNLSFKSDVTGILNDIAKDGDAALNEVKALTTDDNRTQSDIAIAKDFLDDTALVTANVGPYFAAANKFVDAAAAYA